MKMEKSQVNRNDQKCRTSPLIWLIPKRNTSRITCPRRARGQPAPARVQPFSSRTATTFHRPNRGNLPDASRRSLIAAPCKRPRKSRRSCKSSRKHRKPQWKFLRKLKKLRAVPQAVWAQPGKLSKNWRWPSKSLTTRCTLRLLTRELDLKLRCCSRRNSRAILANLSRTSTYQYSSQVEGKDHQSQ